MCAHAMRTEASWSAHANWRAGTVAWAADLLCVQSRPWCTRLLYESVPPYEAVNAKRYFAIALLNLHRRRAPGHGWTAGNGRPSLTACDGRRRWTGGLTALTSGNAHLWRAARTTSPSTPLFTATRGSRHRVNDSPHLTRQASRRSNERWGARSAPHFSCMVNRRNGARTATPRAPPTPIPYHLGSGVAFFVTSKGGALHPPARGTPP